MSAAPHPGHYNLHIDGLNVLNIIIKAQTPRIAQTRHRRQTSDRTLRKPASSGPDSPHVCHYITAPVSHMQMYSSGLEGKDLKRDQDLSDMQRLWLKSFERSTNCRSPWLRLGSSPLARAAARFASVQVTPWYLTFLFSFWRY